MEDLQEMQDSNSEIYGSLENIIHSMNYNIYLTVRRKKMTLFLDTLEHIRVYKLKKMIEAILKIRPADQQLFLMFKDNNYLDKYEELSDSTAFLSDYGLTSVAATAVHPAILGLAVRQKNGSFESLEMTPYSDSDLPEFPIDGNFENTEKYTIAYRKRYIEMMEKLTNAKLNTSFD